MAVMIFPRQNRLVIWFYSSGSCILLKLIIHVNSCIACETCIQFQQMRQIWMVRRRSYKTMFIRVVLPSATRRLGTLIILVRREKAYMN